MDNGIQTLSGSDTKANPSRKFASIRFVKEKRSKAEKRDASSGRSSDEELSGVELEGPPSSLSKKRSSSWRLAAMFTKSQSNPKPDRAPTKQSVFPNNGNILKKKARSTILSVLSKRQTQEKFFLEEKADDYQNSSVNSSELTSQKTKWPSEAMVVDLATTKPAAQRPTSFAVKSQSYHQFAPPNQSWASLGSDDRPSEVSEVKASEQGNFSSRNAETTYVGQTGLDAVDGSRNVAKISSRWPPQQKYESLGWRRGSAPKHLSCPPEIETAVKLSDTKVVSMSPSYTSVKDITPDSPRSPKFETDSVRVSIPFQVQGHQSQPAKLNQRTYAWSSSVSICVPFQVNENNEGVSVLPPSGPSLPVESSPAAANSLVVPDGRLDERDGVVITKPRAHSSPQSGRRKQPKEPHPKDKKTGKESPKIMGKEASKHKPTEKSVSSTALRVPTGGGKARSRSFNVGDRPKSAASPTGTPSTGTPRSSPSSSPKPPRRNALSKDMNKKRPSEVRKQENHGRPHSDPLLAEKMNNKKKPVGVAANDSSASGKLKNDVETLKSKVKDLEQENSELKEKVQPMEQRLAVVSLLEKEKIHLQKQFSDITLENDKAKTELESVTILLKKQSDERNELQARYDQLTRAFENSQDELKDLKNQFQSLEEKKSIVMRESDEKVEAIGKYLDNIEKLTSSNTALVLQEGRLRSKILTLNQGLQTLKDCVVELRDENKGLQSQILDNGSELTETFRKCVTGLEKVVDGLEKKEKDKIEKETQPSPSTYKKETQCGDSNSVDLILSQLEESKKSVECLKNRINELEKENESTESSEREESDGNKPTDCDGCRSLQTQIQAVSNDLELVKSSLQKSEHERDDAVEERNELRREAKYLKYVLSYREDVQSLQQTNQQAKELEKMGTNLVEAEKKVIDLEEEVGRLQEEKQTLLLSILNLYSGNGVEDVSEENEEEEEEDGASDDDNENKQQENEENGGEVFEKASSVSLSPLISDSASRREQLKFRFQLSLSESEYSFTTEGEEESDSEVSNTLTEDNFEAIKTENRQLKSSLFAANEEKEELVSSLDKLCEDYDSLKERFDKLDEDYAESTDRARKDKIAFQSRLRQIEMDRENMRDTLRQVHDEKLSLLKCLEMKNSAAQTHSPLPEPDMDKIIARAQSFAQEENNSSDLDLETIIARAQTLAQEESRGENEPNDLDIEKIIARAQSFAQEENKSSDLDVDKVISRTQSLTREENKSSEPTSNEEESEGFMSSESEDDGSEPAGNKEVIQKRSDNAVASKPVVDRDLAALVASIENDLGILKERLNTRDDDSVGEEQEARPRKPHPGARILKRQASTVKSNLDRVCREKQHLQEEVESLRRYLLKRRDSAMDLRKKRSRGSLKRDASELENHLEGIKTLQALLGKSDEQLRQSNDIISRLEAVNDETEEKLREAEVLREDMRQAVHIANNFAMEEQQKSERILLQNQELLRQIESLKHSGAVSDEKDKGDFSKKKIIPKGKSLFALKGSRSYNRYVSEDDYEDDESNFTTEGESDFHSSRHSSFASESEFLKSPHEPSDDNTETSRDLNLNLASPSGEVESVKSQETEPDGRVSQHSSALESSDSEDDTE